MCVSQVYPENVNSPGPVTDDELLPLLEESDDPLLEVPLPDDPLLEVPLPDDPLLEVPPPDAPLWAGTNGMLPPPHPAMKTIANSRTLILSMKCPLKWDRDLRTNPLRPDTNAGP